MSVQLAKKITTMVFSPEETASIVAGVKAVATSASTDTYREILTNINVEIANQNIKLIATNSYMLTVVTLGPFFDMPLSAEFQFMVNAKQLVAALPKGAKKVIELVFRPDDLVVKHVNEGATFHVEYKEGEFPNWQSLTSEKDTVPTEVVTPAFNPKLMALLMKQADVFRGKGEEPVKIQPALSEFKPVHMELTVIDRGHWYGLIMPVRIP